MTEAQGGVRSVEMDALGECLVCGVKFYDETAYRQYVTGERHHHKGATNDECSQLGCSHPEAAHGPDGCRRCSCSFTGGA